MSGVSARARGLVVPPFDALNHKAAALRECGKNVISLGQAVPGFPPPAVAIDAARRALTNPDAQRYSADAGLLSLRTALCDRFKGSLNVEVDPDDVIVTAGGNQAFMLAAMAVVDPGDEVVLAAPYFVNHEMAVRAVGAVPVEAPVHESAGFSARWSDIEPHLTNRTKAVVLCTPSNPTGAVIGADALSQIVAELSSRHIMLVCDETYLHFVFDGVHASAAAIPGWRENVIVVGTFSKSFAMTGWRVGFMLADRGICEQTLKLQDAMIICAPMISQIAVEAAVRDNWNYVHAFHDELRSRRSVLADALAAIPALHWTPTNGGFFAFVRVAGERHSERLADEILERTHVVTIPGGAFGRSGEGFLRLSYGAAGVDELTEACSRLRQFFSGERARA
jgi:aminotransferase